jgi:hypothetical protein
MKKILLASVFCFAALGASTVMADTTNIAAADAAASSSSSSGASSNQALNQTIEGSVALAGIGGNCSNGVTLGVPGTGAVGFNFMTRVCKVQVGKQIGAISDSEARAMYLGAMGTTPAALQAQIIAGLPNITGDWKNLSKKQRAAISNCKATWNGNPVNVCVGVY